jgi:hypothetical protein
MKPAPSAASARSPLRVLAPGWPGGRTALVALVAALVVGILGMHALASHDAPVTPAAAAPSSRMSMAGAASGHDVAMAAGTSHESHVHPAAAHASGGAADISADAGSDSGHGMASMVMLCVVMLAAAALTSLVVAAAAVFQPLLPAAFKPAVVSERALQWVRGIGPPHEWQFSVIRC